MNQTGIGEIDDEKQKLIIQLDSADYAVKYNDLLEALENAQIESLPPSDETKNTTVSRLDSRIAIDTKDAKYKIEGTQLVEIMHGAGLLEKENRTLHDLGKNLS